VEPFGAMQLLPPFVLQRLAAGFPSLYFVCFEFWFDLRSSAFLNEDRSKIWAYWPVPNIRPFHLREQFSIGTDSFFFSLDAAAPA
jgi:hypothetical protein